MFGIIQSAKGLQEGDTKTTQLPTGTEHKMIEKKQFGRHTITIQRKAGVEAAKVDVADYNSWDKAFDVAMDKAGL